MKNQKGQALIELIIFLPLMFMLYSVISGYANAINGSINQQKVTRSYFYFRAQNNSTLPKPDPDEGWRNWTRFGMFFIGWKESFNGRTPVLPCYKVSIPIGAAPGDVCAEKYTTGTTQWIRVGTVYGVCGATFARYDQDVVHVPNHPSESYFGLIDRSSCEIKN